MMEINVYMVYQNKVLLSSLANTVEEKKGGKWGGEGGNNHKK